MRFSSPLPVYFEWLKRRGRILTVVTTLRLQQRNVLDYVTSACQGHCHGQPAPSLLPPRALVESSPAAR